MMGGSGSKPLTNGSGSRRPKNLRISIQNTAFCHIWLATEFSPVLKQLKTVFCRLKIKLGKSQPIRWPIFTPLLWHKRIRNWYRTFSTLNHIYSNYTANTVYIQSDRLRFWKCINKMPATDAHRSGLVCVVRTPSRSLGACRRLWGVL